MVLVLSFNGKYNIFFIKFQQRQVWTKGDIFLIHRWRFSVELQIRVKIEYTGPLEKNPNPTNKIINIMKKS